MSFIVTGEKIQQLCDVYLGFEDDFSYNPLIKNQPNKQVSFNNLSSAYNNPYYIFCYSHRINELSRKICLFQNNFILVTHNSDRDIRPIEEVFDILNCEKLLKWYGQNICFDHIKLQFLPIGLANSIWEHGNLLLFNDNSFIKNICKTKKVYFNFLISTNSNKRQICYDELKNKLEWLENINPIDNQLRLKEYEFCICPEGYGLDSHRLWEALYLKTVPIVIKSEFTDILKKQDIPIVILENWQDFDINKLNYSDFDFDNQKFIKLLHFDINYLQYQRN
jgi:hypothetical protein